jgi:hypothetical protein
MTQTCTIDSLAMSTSMSRRRLSCTRPSSSASRAAVSRMWPTGTVRGGGGREAFLAAACDMRGSSGTQGWSLIRWAPHRTVGRFTNPPLASKVHRHTLWMRSWVEAACTRMIGEVLGTSCKNIPGPRVSTAALKSPTEGSPGATSHACRSLIQA